MRRHLIALGYGLGGVTLALALTFGALAVAGPKVGDPTTPLVFDLTTPTPPSPAAASPGPDKGNGKETPKPDATKSVTASPSVDDHGGASSSLNPNSGGSDDTSGSGHEADD